MIIVSLLNVILVIAQSVTVFIVFKRLNRGLVPVMTTIVALVLLVIRRAYMIHLFLTYEMTMKATISEIVLNVGVAAPVLWAILRLCQKQGEVSRKAYDRVQTRLKNGTAAV